jgi:NitT/TauT family transport system permease protein
MAKAPAELTASDHAVDGDGRESDPAVARPGGRAAAGSWTGRLSRFLVAFWPPALVLGAIGLVWWYIADREIVPNYQVPRPMEVYHTFRDQWPLLAQSAGVTLYETVLGFVLSVVIGLATAVFIVYSPAFDRAVFPLVLFAQVVPKIAIAPLLIVWFGTEMKPKVILAVLIAFFPVVISGVAGLRSTDPELLDLSATMGASRWQTFRKIRFPNSLPHLMAGVKVAVTLAVVGAVVGEFIGSSEGLGYVLLLAHGNLDSPLLYADLILMSAIGIALFVVVDIAEKLLIPWHASRRSAFPLTTA